MDLHGDRAIPLGQALTGKPESMFYIDRSKQECRRWGWGGRKYPSEFCLERGFSVLIRYRCAMG